MLSNRFGRAGGLKMLPLLQNRCSPGSAMRVTVCVFSSQAPKSCSDQNTSQAGWGRNMKIMKSFKWF